MRQLVILAGGRGTRLRERLGGLPKPLVDICGVPLLGRQIELAKKYGFSNVLILVDYESQKIIDYCNHNNNWGILISCINDGGSPLGTAGAVLRVKNLLEDEFMVMYGDTMLDVDLSRFIVFHNMVAESAATLFLHPNDHPIDSDLVEVDHQGNIKNFFPYPHPEDQNYANLVNAALYCIRKSTLEVFDLPLTGGLDFGKNLFPMMLQKGLLLRGYNSPEYIKDCGTPSRLDKVCEDFKSGKIKSSSLENAQKAIFIDRDGTINFDIGHIKRVEEFVLIPGTASAIKKINKSEYKACIVTNQPVIARGECTEEVLKNIHNKMETLLGNEGAYLDRIYYCPHHPDSGYEGEIGVLKIHCSCRKPNLGMVDMAVEDLNLDLGSSWIVGDTTSDICLGKRAGMKSILVETGYAGMDGKFLVVPDFIVPSFSDAIDFILYKFPVMLARSKLILKETNPGAVLMISGQSRSGKSTVASVFKAALEDVGKACKIISTDRWLLSSGERENSFLGKHDIKGLREFCYQLVLKATNGQEFKVPFYSKGIKHQYKNAETISINSEEIIILEGVSVPLICDLFPNSARYYLDIDENARRARVLREYELRGENAENALKIYKKHFEEEFGLVEGFSEGATKLTVQQLLGSI